MQRLFLRCSVLCLLLGLIISTPQVGRSQEHSPHQPNTTYPVPTAPDRQAMSDITSFGGGVRFIYPHDGRTYVGQQNRFTIYDLTSTPVRQLGQQTVPGYITDISVQNNRAYVTYTVVGVGGGLIVFDVSDPSHIIALDGIANTSGVYQVIVQGSLAYIQEWVYIRVLDVSNPSAIVELGKYHSNNAIKKMVLQDNTIYFTTHYMTTFVTLNVSNPIAPTFVASTTLALASGTDFEVQGNTAFFASGNTISAVDISNPAVPILHGNYTYDNVQDIIVSGSYLYARDYSDLIILNIQNLDSFTLLYDSTTIQDYSGLFSAIFYENQELHATSWSRYTIFDATNPTNLSEKRSIYTISRLLSLRSYPYKDTLYIAGDLRFDIYSKQNLVPIPYNYSKLRLGYVQDIAIQENYAYLAEVGHLSDALLDVIDITDPYNIKKIGSYVSSGYYVSKRIEVRGSTAFILTDSNLQSIDVSNPVTPTLMGTYQLPTGATAKDMQIGGQYAYLALGSAGVRIINISNPAQMQEVYHYPYNANALDVANQRLYVALNYPYGLHVLDISNPHNPVLIGSNQQVWYANTLHIEGNLVYISGIFRVEIYDVTNPQNIIERAFFKTANYASHIAVDGNMLYVSEKYDGMQILQTYPDLFMNQSIVNSNGGTLTSYNQNVHINFPAGAVTNAVTMTYSGLLQPSQPLAQVTNSKPFLSFRIDAIQSNDQPLTSTLLPYTVTISTTPLLAQYPNLSLGSLHVFAWDDNQWKAVSLCQSCRSASTSSTLKFQTNLLTEFVVVGEVANHKIYLPLIRK